MKVGRSQIDFDSLVTDGPSGSVSMELKVMEVFAVLVAHAGKVVTREQLINSVWGVGHGADERLTRAISLIRKALGDDNPHSKLIKTIPRRGYKLIAQVEPSTSGPISANANNPDKQLPESGSGTKALRRMVGLITAATLVGATGFAALYFGPQNNSPSARSQSGRISTAASPSRQIPLGTMNTGLSLIKNYTQVDAIPRAQTLFSDILASNPDHAAARAGLSLALIREYTHLGADPALLQRARSQAEAAYRSDQHLALSSVARGWAYEFAGELAEAQKAYDRADILDPKNLFVIEGRIRTLNKLGEGKAVEDALAHAIIDYPDYAVFHSFSGQLALSQNRFSEAEKHFKNAVARAPDNPRGYAQLAHAVHMQNRTEEAIQILQDGLERYKSPLLYNNLGTFLFFSGRYSMAIDAFEKTLELDGDVHDYLYWGNIADAYRQVPKYKKKAQQAYENAIKIAQIQLAAQPDNLTLITRLALYHAKRGKLLAAEDLLSKAEPIANWSAYDFYRAAVVYEILADRDQAFDMLESALANDYPFSEIQNDPELYMLRQDRRFISLLPAQDQP